MSCAAPVHGFAASFAADVAAEKAQFMADSQVPWGLVALNGAVTQPAWASKPSCYLVSTDDKMIPPPAPARSPPARVPPGIFSVSEKLPFAPPIY